MNTATFNITPHAFGIIMQGLNELPHKVSRAVIDELMRQAEALEKPSAAAAPATSTPANPVPEPV